MNGLVLAALIVEGLAFAVWAYAMFRALFAIRGLAVGETGSPFPGPLSFLRAVRLWLADPASRGGRRLLAWASLALALAMAAQALAVFASLPGQAPGG